MKAMRVAVIITGFGVIAALYFTLGSGALGTGDQQLGAAIPGPAGGVSSSPSAGAASTPNNSAPAGQLPAGAASTSIAARNPALLLISPGNIVPENVLTASGQGFSRSEQVDLVVNGAQKGAEMDVPPVTADKDGNFYGLGITVTFGTPAGDYAVTARGRKSGSLAQSSFHVSSTAPWANPSTYSGKGASQVGFTGGGFLPSEVVSLHFDSLAVDPLMQVVAGSDGGVVITATVPLASAGDHSFIIVGQRGGFPLRVPFSVVGFGPWIAPSDYSPRPEQSIGFTGHDFAPGEVVHLYQGKVDDHPVGTATADDEGEVSVADVYELPDSSVGANRFLAQGIHSQTVVSATVNVLPFDPSLELSVYAGQPGTRVSLKGKGYARGEMITVYLGRADGGREMAKFRAGQDGAFEDGGAFPIPSDAKPGNVTIAALGERSRRPLDISFAVLPLSPWVGLSQFAGPPGSTITLLGHGFLPGENVRVHLSDAHGNVLATVSTDGTGSFGGAGPYTLSGGAKDKLTFLVVGETSQTQATATFTVTESGDATTVTTSATNDSPGGQ